MKIPSVTSPARVIVTLPHMEQIRFVEDLLYKTIDRLELRYDVYCPPDVHAGELRLAIIFIHDEAPPDILKDAKDRGPCEAVSHTTIFARAGEGHTQYLVAHGVLDGERVGSQHKIVGQPPYQDIGLGAP